MGPPGAVAALAADTFRFRARRLAPEVRIPEENRGDAGVACLAGVTAGERALVRSRRGELAGR